MATITIPRHSSCSLALALALALSGCGGGDFQVDAAIGDTQARSAALPAPSASADPGEGPAAAAASAPDAHGESTLRIRRQPQGVEVAEGEVAQFGVEVVGPRSVTYQWLRDEQPIDGETGPVLRLRANAADHLARISVIVRAGRSTVRSDASVLRVG